MVRALDGSGGRGCAGPTGARGLPVGAGGRQAGATARRRGAGDVRTARWAAGRRREELFTVDLFVRNRVAGVSQSGAGWPVAGTVER